MTITQRRALEHAIQQSSLTGKRHTGPATTIQPRTGWMLRIVAAARRMMGAQ